MFTVRKIRGISPTEIKTRAAFLENILQASDNLSIVTAFRYEELELDRLSNSSGVREASASIELSTGPAGESISPQTLKNCCRICSV